jgi:hypothetical protein
MARLWASTATVISRRELIPACLLASIAIHFYIASVVGAASLSSEHTLTYPTIRNHPIAAPNENRFTPDAPSYYHLNELLYKTTNGDESPQAIALPNLRPLDGAHLKPRGMKALDTAAADGDTANANEDESPIDGATKETMQGRRPHGTSFMGGKANGAADRDGAGLMRGQADARNSFRPDDDATIQRKSTNLDDDSVDEPQPSRLRARGE